MFTGNKTAAICCFFINNVKEFIYSLLELFFFQIVRTLVNMKVSISGMSEGFNNKTTFFSGLIYLFTQVSREEMGVYSTLVANIILFTIILLFILWGLWKKINVYDAFIEGAKEGFTTAIRIVPYLVAFLVGIAVFRTSGAMDIIVNGIGYIVGLSGADTEFVGALPTALMKSLSGSGANGLMIDTMKQYGADSFVGRMSCVARGASDTTFYILAVYFGSVGITKTRNAVTCGLIADFSGIIAAIIISYIFFF